MAGKGILKAPFGKLCKWYIQELSKSNFQIQPRALDALQHSAEEYLVKLFADARLAMLSRVRPQEGRGEGELLLRDLQLARRIYGISDTGGYDNTMVSVIQGDVMDDRSFANTS